MENRIEKVQKRSEKIERNMTAYQENLNIYHCELEENFNMIEHLLAQLLWKEAANGNGEALHYLHQHQISGEFVIVHKDAGYLNAHLGTAQQLGTITKYTNDMVSRSAAVSVLSDPIHEGYQLNGLQVEI